jgi:hypothetical protein
MAELIKTGKSTGSNLSIQVVMLLLPFILGFSTSLVIFVLNQMLEAVQTFFGRKSTSGSPPLSLPPGTNREAALHK